jgi:hypothetical protein
MMPSSAIDARPDTRSSCRLSAGSDQACIALFGRRPQQRVEGFVMPASKNLHNNGLMHCSKTLLFSASL